MDMKSLNSVRFNPNNGLYNLFTLTFVYNPFVELFEYVVTDGDEMRIDLVFGNIYNIDITRLDLYTNDIDVLLYINGIDNPLNIKKDMIIKYPSIDDLDKFRYNTELETSNSTSVIEQLSVPNLPSKATRKDRSRQNYIENDFSLPPVVLDTPREPVRIDGNNFSIGGI